MTTMIFIIIFLIIFILQPLHFSFQFHNSTSLNISHLHPSSPTPLYPYSIPSNNFISFPSFNFLCLVPLLHDLSGSFLVHSSSFTFLRKLVPFLPSLGAACTKGTVGYVITSSLRGSRQCPGVRGRPASAYRPGCK